MTSALEYLILGHEHDEQGEKQRKLLLFNGALPSLDPVFYTGLVDLEAMADDNGAGQPSLAVVEYDGPQLLLVTVQPSTHQPGSFNDHYVFIPADALPESASQFESWLALLPEASRDTNVTLPLLQSPAFTANDTGSRAAYLLDILDRFPEDGFEHLLTLLGAVMDERPLMIRGFPPDFSLRLAFVSGIQALVPGKLASRITYASYAPLMCRREPQLVFVDDLEDDSALIFDWRSPQIISGVLDHPFLDVLRLLWSGDVPALASDIQRMAAKGLPLGEPGELTNGLRQLAERFWVDHNVQTGADVSTDIMIGILEGSDLPSKNLRQLYIEKLLQNALNNRDAAAGRWVAEELARDAELEVALSGLFDDMLDDQPDAVYVFIRNRLVNLGMDERWIPRLHRAAQNSLEVAIQDGDVGTVAGWLELIAHEPLAYQLQDILRESILAAAKRAYNDGELGIQLILIAARRVPEIVDDLYGDSALVAALDSNVRAALQSASAETLDALIDEKAEFFLLALYNGINSSDQLLVTMASTRKLLALADSETRADLPAVYRAPALIRLLATQASHQMSDEALDILFRYIIDGDDRNLIAEVVHHLADHELLFPRLSGALERDSLPLDKVLSIMHAVNGIKSAAPRDVIETYFALLDYYQWEPQTQRMMEALARMMAKNHDVQISYRHLWTLFGYCQELQIEGATRVAVSQLLVQFAEEEDLPLVVDGLSRVCRQIAFSKSLQEAVNNWWREYTHNCALPQLQRLQRELDTQRHLEPQKHILKTVLAMRRWLHSRGPVALAEAINTAFIMLEHITDAFDIAGLSEADPHTIRREVDGVGRELSSEQRHILANNLRNLANRVTQMAENRSKPSLIRSDDSIDRQLMHGEAIPQGSIDMLKWIAGYLDGAHPQKND